jgi:hypothetical protein
MRVGKTLTFYPGVKNMPRPTKVGSVWECTFAEIPGSLPVEAIRSNGLNQQRSGYLSSHLGLVLNPARYIQITGHVFNPPVNPGPNPVMPHPYMTVQEAEIVYQEHCNDLIVYYKFLNTNKALSSQLVEAIDNRYLKAMKQNMIGYNDQEIRELLQHVYQNYGHVMPFMMAKADKQIKQPFNPSLLIEGFFEQFDTIQDHCIAGGNPYSDAQLITIAFDLIFCTAVHNDACKEWIFHLGANKTWSNFCVHFTNDHQYFHDSQQISMQAVYTANTSCMNNLCMYKQQRHWHNQQQQQKKIDPQYLILLELTLI